MSITLDPLEQKEVPSVKVNKALWKKRKPRQWQKVVYPAIVKHLASLNPEPAIISAVMGSGKSAIIAEVATNTVLKKNEVVLITTNTIALVDSLYKETEAISPGKVGRFYSYAKDIKPITVACNDSLAKFIKLAKDEGITIKLFIIDEAHETETNYFLGCIERLNCAILGLTGTAFRTDENHKLSIFKKLIFKYGVAEAIKDGVVVDWLIKNNNKKGGSNNEICMRMIKKEAGQGIANANDIKDATHFNKYLNENGVESTVIHSKLPRSEIIRRTDDFADGKYKCMVHVGLLRNGVDIPFIKWSMLRRRTSSRLRFIQEVGRLLRTHKDKSRAIFLDPQDLFDTFDISPAEALGYYAIGRKRFMRDILYSEFERYAEADDYEIILAVENLIRNIQVKLSLYGFNLSRKHTAAHLFEKNKKMLLKMLEKTSTVKDKQWRKFLEVVKRKIGKLRSGYCYCLVKILEAIKIIEFYPSFDDELKTIELTKKQQTLLVVLNARGNTRLLTFDGKTLPLSTWARNTNQAKTTLLWRYKAGWSVSEVINGRMSTDDLIGKKFGLLTVVGSTGRAKWLCKCACGNRNLSAVQKNHLFDKTTQSCGCDLEGSTKKTKETDNYAQKLTEAKVKRIWERLRRDPASKIALDYSVGPRVIANIKTQRTWKQVTQKLKPHLCLWKEDKCKKKALWRGLCKIHYQRANVRNILDDIAIPNERIKFIDLKLTVKKKTQVGVCRVIENSKGCGTVELTRGLCARHYGIAKMHNILDKVARKRLHAFLKISDFALKAKRKEGICKLRVDGKNCTNFLHGRGLCSQHYTWLQRRKCLAKFADPTTRG